MFNIAIDGPSGAGKSTVARAAAKQLGFIYVDTGALYRAIGLFAVRAGADTKDAGQIVQLLDGIELSLKIEDGTQHVIMNGEDVSGLIRTPEISMAASDVSKVPEVRTFLLQLQRDIAAQNDCLMDGRDIATVILPDAQIKIFLTASAEVRAKRRYLELLEKGENVTYGEVLDDVNKRDYQDSHREIAPLKPSEQSVIVDTSDMSLEQSTEAVISIVREKYNK
ncbi:MAG: (d)CMP kinase [Clostridia bacterium]|nr:(d)CMP kinase [Clostridia bacterium]